MNNCPVTGEICNRYRFNHITDIDSGQVTETHCCTKCIDSFLTNGQSKKGISFLQKVFGFFSQARCPVEPACPVCEMKFNDLIRVGRIGCEYCYTYFFEDLQNLLLKIHGATKHTGKSNGRVF